MPCTVDVDDGSIDIGSSVGAKPEGDIGDFLRLAEAICGNTVCMERSR